MKKEWNVPTIDVLDVSNTMLGSTGDYLDNDFAEGTPRGELTFS